MAKFKCNCRMNEKLFSYQDILDAIGMVKYKNDNIEIKVLDTEIVLQELRNIAASRLNVVKSHKKEKNRLKC